MVQCKCFFWRQAEYVCWKICWKGFWMCCGSILFSISSEFRFIKWVSFFKQNCIVKWVIFFANFCWLCDFLLKNLKSKKKNSDDVHWNAWTNIKKSCARRSIFKKIIPNMRLWIIYFLVQMSFFGKLLQSVLASVFFFNSASTNHGGWYFYSVPC